MFQLLEASLNTDQTLRLRPILQKAFATQQRGFESSGRFGQLDEVVI